MAHKSSGTSARDNDSIAPPNGNAQWLRIRVGELEESECGDPEGR